MVAERKHHLPVTGVGRSQNRPALTPIETPIHILLVELILIQVTLTQVDIPDKTQQVTQELVVTLTSTLVEPILEDIPTRTLPVAIQLEEVILTNILLQEATQQEEVIPTNALVPEAIQLEEVILISTLLQEAILQEEVIRTSAQVPEAIQWEVILTSTQQQVVIQSEGGIQDRVLVCSLV